MQTTGSASAKSAPCRIVLNWSPGDATEDRNTTTGINGQQRMRLTNFQCLPPAPLKLGELPASAAPSR